ncbi:MAG: hypothetical protein C5B60_12255 [Chloroflexi bacterium]|nr:MAG: hypothetical protein C5B60_12255 [Chloroflexota bacterium]
MQRRQITRASCGLLQRIQPSAAVSAVWRSRSVVIARLALQSYFRSGWLWGECAYVIVVYAVFFGVFAVSMDTFFGIAHYSMWALAVLGTTILFRRATTARAYLHLAWLPSRAAYVRGHAVAAGVLRIPLFALLLLLTLGTGKLLHPTAGWLLLGSLGAVMNCLVIVALAIALCPPIATRVEQIGFLAWLVAAVYSYTGGPLAPVLALLRLPLLPFGASYNFSVTGVLDWTGAVSLVIEVLYIAGLIWLAESRMARRDLALQ